MKEESAPVEESLEAAFPCSVACPCLDGDIVRSFGISCVRGVSASIRVSCTEA